MDLVASAVLPIFALIFSGWLAARLRVLPPAATDGLNSFVVWLALPAVLFQAVAQARFAELWDWRFIVAYGGGMVITFVLSLASDRRGGTRLCDRTIEALDAAYPNSGFLGIPLCLALFGQAGLPPAILAALLTTTVIFAVAIVLIEVDLHRAVSWRSIAGKVAASLARNPLIVAPVLGGALNATGLPLPEPLLRFTALLGGAASPCALVTIGLFLAGRSEAGERPRIARLVALKLLVQPAVTAAMAFGLFSLSPLRSHAALLLSALPTGTGPFMLARFYGRDAASTSRAILVSTILSLASLSVLVLFFGHL